ncbi:MAG: NUDIX hydrolase [Acidobacteria bacterium]|nr:NUDIX hydrolase [Acidobacteriota bacterium]
MRFLHRPRPQGRTAVVVSPTPGSNLIPGRLGPPGGHIDTGESMADALVRELGEELDAQIEAPDGPPS